MLKTILPFYEIIETNEKLILERVRPKNSNL